MPSNLPGNCSQQRIDALTETAEEAEDREWWESLTDEERQSWLDSLRRVHQRGMRQ